MARYQVTSPSGDTYEIEAPDDATSEQVMAYAQQQFAQQTETQAPAPRTLMQRAKDFMFTAPPAPPRMPLRDLAIGSLDIGSSMLRGMVNKPAASLAGLGGAIDPNDTYRAAQARGREEIERGDTIVRSERLRTPQGQQMAEAYGGAMKLTGIPQAMNALGSGIEKMAGPDVRDFAGSAASLASVGAPRALATLGKAAPTAEEVVAGMNQGRSAGAAAAATDVSSVSPELRGAIVKAGKSGRPLSPEALSRQVEADTLPVPVPLTEGEALQDARLISEERNLRGKHPEMGGRMDEANKALGQNIQALRDAVGPEVFTTNAVEHGDKLIGAYRAKDAAAQAQIAARYKALRDANGGEFPVDANALLNSASEQLHQRLLFDHAPAAVMSTLRRLAEGKMTFENFESLRTNLARIQRSSRDGNEVAAAGVIRGAMEALPLDADAAKLKPLADQARAAAREHFQELEADPAYKSAVNETTPADRFVRRFVLAAPRDDVATLMRNLADVPEVPQTVRVAVLDYLREAARLDATYTGNFSSAGFSRALAALDPKARILFDAKTAEDLGKLRNVANYTTFQPRGSFVNNSNTAVAAAARYGTQAAEGAANVAAGGIPIGTWIRNGLEAAGTGRRIKRALRPGAGIVPPRGVTRSGLSAAEQADRRLTEAMLKKRSERTP